MSLPANSSSYPDLALLIGEAGQWGLYALSLRWIKFQAGYVRRGPFVEEEDVASDDDIKRLLRLCRCTEPAGIYKHMEGSKYSNPKAFFEKATEQIRSYTAKQVGRKLCDAFGLAAKLGVHIFLTPPAREPLETGNELTWCADPMEIQTLFRKTDDGIDYRLSLSGNVLPSQRKVKILSNRPSLFVLDKEIRRLPDGLNGKMLMPFVNKEWIHIPKRSEEDYFKQFVLKIVSLIEIRAEGFEMDEKHPAGSLRLSLEQNIQGKFILSPTFIYDGRKFTDTDRRSKAVSIVDTPSGIGFVSVNRNNTWEHSIMKSLRSGLLMPEYASLAEMTTWIARHSGELKRMGVEIKQNTSRHYYIGEVRIVQDSSRRGDWFQMHIALRFDDGRQIPISDLRNNILNGDQEYLLPDGDWFVIPQEWMARFAPVLLFGLRRKDGTISVHRSQMSLLDLSATEPAEHSDNKVFDSSLPVGLKATLRPYQMDGFKWIIGHLNARTGCCLSDDMGLGKTVQTIAVVQKYKEQAGDKPRKTTIGKVPVQLSLFPEMGEPMVKESDCKPVLVLAPTSVVTNWYRELHRFAPSLRVLRYCDSPAERKAMLASFVDYDIVLTSYQILRNDIDALSSVEWGICVMDEAQKFKNPDSLLHEAVCRLRSTYRLALTGTPIENSLSELWSLMSVLQPELLGDRKSFYSNFIRPISDNLQSLKTTMLSNLVAPFFLRRTKEEVLTSLPERQDETIWCEMSEEQQSAYERELSKMRNQMFEGGRSKVDVVALAALARLRQMACDPRLVDVDAPSGKTSEVLNRLEELHGTDHKVLIFSEYVGYLKLVVAALEARKWKFAMLTGSTSNRQEVIDRFQTDKNCQYFLISLKAGGVGLNLTEADYVFILDPWWNTAAEEQAVSRAHRMGQRHSVFVYRFITTGTVEEQVLQVQGDKKSLVEAVMGKNHTL